jgi:hypothetical protein
LLFPYPCHEDNTFDVLEGWVGYGGKPGGGFLFSWRVFTVKNDDTIPAKYQTDRKRINCNK